MTMPALIAALDEMERRYAIENISMEDIADDVAVVVEHYRKNRADGLCPLMCPVSRSLLWRVITEIEVDAIFLEKNGNPHAASHKRGITAQLRKSVGEKP